MNFDRLTDWIVRESRDALDIRSDWLLCANVEVYKKKHCRNPGKLSCSKCKLVSYCSKACQTNHWSVHKRDCKSTLMSDDWKPAWEHERRVPAFMSMGGGPSWSPPQLGPLAGGLHLWGNVPALDLINLGRNEKSHDVDLSLACIASGDLRNVVKTVNELPEDYSGQLTILINDRDPVVVMRNIFLLGILGTIEDDKISAELALHFWYSICMPIEYHVRILSTMRPFIDIVSQNSAVTGNIALGTHSSVSWNLPQEFMMVMAMVFASRYSMSDSSAQYQAVRFAPSRKDYHDRAYCRIEPAHRVSLQEYRLFGLVLPFGALNAHFNFPNRSLFSPNGTWLQNDHVTPLESWDIESVIEAGKRHGAQRADLFGCLYFFLTEQLRTFSKRLRQFRISFHVFNEDAQNLPKCIPASMRFDRIEVSNIMDVEYIGIARVLQAWAPLLKDTKSAAIVGYFMNWVARQQGADPMTADRRVINDLMDRLGQSNRYRATVTEARCSRYALPSELQLSEMNALPSFLFSISHYLGAMYDNSSAFNKFLKAQNIDSTLRKFSLRMRKQNAILPHRNCAPVGASLNSLPRFPTDESWYLNVQLGSLAWSERYVEFCR
ncbi:hypothetical protein NEOLEDRAFT_1068540 [Neolentinus lepideus HHB14362 ss-1]|uniref:MYND-type domain-containing protein n=1 Tax=Neolentinus lepideus HHB14362 ss-1 TaxID=1314782 RepID=A0A165RJS1_9AGAM|nr:hypothetical protein NEOLEDRAFT_1068540 [Neolentinus lepideus HHB14362 ss-1]